MEPWFSIIVPVYNVEDYLEKCIDSLLKQTFCSKEIILVDDGSTDQSGKMCDEIAFKNNFVSVIHKTNGGLSSARNAGLKLASGKYISFVDADDWLEQDALEIIFNKSRDTVPDILNFGYQKIHKNKILIKEHAVFSENHYKVEEIKSLLLPESIARERAFDQVNLPVQLSSCMCVYNRNFLQSNNIWFESERVVLNEDWLFNIQCLCRAQSIVILHDILYNYYTRETSLSTTHKADSYERRKVLFEKYVQELKRTNLYNEDIKQRLRVFWIESIYCCYIIELNAPVWNKEAKDRIKKICNDRDFLAYAKMLNSHNCKMKGFAFLLVISIRAHWIIRKIYKIKKLLGNI